MSIFITQHPSSELRKGDIVLIESGDFVPGDGEVIEGVASSATMPSYNAAASSGSNLGPRNPALIVIAKARLDAQKQADPANTHAVPVDLVTASSSGLDPHISPDAAEFQAAARGFCAWDGCDTRA